ncbi:hypothetical protein IEO21_04105 [Rhodonia placenta]|uniref:F-box domain-containing protein n=1 Tax=Rhodonia placenta TaxID=104341 RepID=A0A8H7U3K3_9APHY|nr:hypothetical protein IEO21_04105 [Postia placenta]
MSLNEDVLIYIASFLTSYDAWQLAQTCRTAYLIAFPRSLAEIDFQSWGCQRGGWRRRSSRDRWGRIAKFCNFIMADADQRAPCIKVLHLRGQALKYYPTPSDDVKSILTDVLRHTTCVRELYLVDMDPVLEAYPELADTVAALSSVECLHVTNAGSFVLHMLSRMTSSPKQLIYHRDTILFLPRRRTCLEALRSSVLTSRIETLALVVNDNTLDDIGTKFVLPSVHTLQLSGTAAVPSKLACCFPNVRSMSFSLTGPSQLLDWPGLDFAGFLPSSSDVKICMPIRRVELVGHIGSSRTLRYFRNASPTVLCVEERDVHIRREDIQSLDEYLPQVRFLELRIRGALNIVDDFLLTLRSVPLVALCLRVCNKRQTKPDEVQLAVLRARARFCIPTLQYVQIVVVHEPEKLRPPFTSSRWYRIIAPVNADYDFELQALSDVEGHLLYQQLLDLHPTPADGRQSRPGATGTPRALAFCAYLSAAPHLAAHIRVLKLDGTVLFERVPLGEDYRDDYSCTLLLTEALLHATNVRELYLVMMDEPLRRHPKLADVLAAMDNVDAVVAKNGR